MTTIFIFIECLLLLLENYMMKANNMIICIIISNIISAVIVFIYCVIQAPDIAITEAVIGTAASTILFSLTMAYIEKLPTISTQNMSYKIDIRQRIFVFILCSILCLLLMNIIQNFPKSQIGDIFTSSHKHISKLYIDDALKDFGFSSIVTAVVAGYRAFDTMFENVVIFTACYGFYTILTMNEKNEEVKEISKKGNTYKNE